MLFHIGHHVRHINEKVKKNKNKKIVQCFITNMIDIKKTLTSKKNINLKEKLYQNFRQLFEFKKTNKLFSFKKPKINHFIEFEKMNDKISQIL